VESPTGSLLLAARSVDSLRALPLFGEGKKTFSSRSAHRTTTTTQRRRAVLLCYAWPRKNEGFVAGWRIAPGWPSPPALIGTVRFDEAMFLSSSFGRPCESSLPRSARLALGSCTSDSRLVIPSICRRAPQSQDGSLRRAITALCARRDQLDSLAVLNGTVPCGISVRGISSRASSSDLAPERARPAAPVRGPEMNGCWRWSSRADHTRAASSPSAPPVVIPSFPNPPGGVRRRCYSPDTGSWQEAALRSLGERSSP
jgi:hypothetical protein